MATPRIAWLLTSAFYYWQPVMHRFSVRFPQTRVFTSRWHGFAPGLEGAFDLECVGQRKVIALRSSKTGYGHHFTYLPLNIVGHLLRFQPDIIFSNAFGVWTLLSLLYKPIGRWRVVIAYEGSAPGVDYRQAIVRTALRRLMVKAADACITNSNAGRTYLMQVLKAADHQVFVQPYEVPDPYHLRCVPSINRLDPRSETVFLFLGGLIPRKGLHLLLEACCILRQRGYQHFTLLVVGEGPERTRLEQFCRDHNLTRMVRWVGGVEYANLGTVFQQADVLILPTLEDTWGMVVLEGMAAGKPIICSKWAGACELVSDGTNGYQIDPRQPRSIATAMSHYLNNANLAATMGQQSRHIMSQYTPETAAQFLSRVTSYVLQHA
jgi:glycosyltransferase involved in cell wall biosynthesis